MCDCCNPHPSGPNTVIVMESGNCNRCDCGPPRFAVHSAVNDQRLINFLGVQEIQQKFDHLNSIYPKKRASPLIFLMMVPPMLVGIICFTRLTEDSFSCAGDVREVCNATAANPNFVTCNRVWCCPGDGDTYEAWYKDGFPDGAGFKAKGCRAAGPSDSAYLNKEKDAASHTFGGYCAKGDDAPMPGCDCGWTRNHKNNKLVCESTVFLEGEKGNYQFIRSNFDTMFPIALCCVELGWIIPFIVFVTKTCKVKKWLTKEFFKDWSDRGIQVSYLPPGKHHDGSLGFVVPPAVGGGTQAVGQPVIMAQVVGTGDAQVVPIKD